MKPEKISVRPEVMCSHRKAQRRIRTLEIFNEIEHAIDKVIDIAEKAKMKGTIKITVGELVSSKEWDFKTY